MNKLNTSDWTKEKKEAYEQALSKLELEKKIKEILEDEANSN